jgi:hypothetical protein
VVTGLTLSSGLRPQKKKKNRSYSDALMILTQI